MPEGHKHRVWRVPSFDVWYVRLLRLPLLHRTVVTPEQHRAVDRSPYPYGLCTSSEAYGIKCYTLSPLGVLHRWFGLTLLVRDTAGRETVERE